VLAVDERVLAVRCHPGLDFDALSAAIAHGDIHGVIIELYASATGPTRSGPTSLAAFARRCRQRGSLVVGTIANAPEDELAPYESTLALLDEGALMLPRILPEVAVVKLMWALAQGSPDRARNLMAMSVAGELAGPGVREAPAIVRNGRARSRVPSQLGGRA
jgi:L-asparaginase/Glu-tRNA(Gln) amidotransferase subunit D